MSTGSWAQASGEYFCGHEGTTRLTVFTASNGVRHYRNQCTSCGMNLGSVKKATIKPAAERTLQPFDEAIRNHWLERVRLRSEEIKQQTAQQSKDAFDVWYEEYLDSPEWARKRGLIFARANGRCEGCGDRRATQVHHLTYTHVGRELLFQLVAVCRDCHEAIHHAQEEPDY